MEGTKTKKSRSKTWGGSSQPYQTMDDIPVIPSAINEAFIIPPAVGDIPVIPPARDDAPFIPLASVIPPARDDTLPIPPARDNVLVIPPSSSMPPLVDHLASHNETRTSARPPNKRAKISIVVQSPVAESKKSFDSQEDQETVHNPQDTGTADAKAQIPEDTLQDGIRDFVMDTLPWLGGEVKKLATDTRSTIYLHFLLRLPYFYLSRVDRLFSDVNLSMLQIVQVATEISIAGDDPQIALSESLENDPTRREATVVYLRLQTRWKNLMDALMEEWKALNMIGVLLLGAIMTMFQIDGAAQDPVTRYLAFCSLICSLLSLLHGCMFIVRFSTMRRASRAAEWALEAQKDPTFFWNVWVMLSMPLFWLTWAIITFIICIMTFMWRSRVQLPDDFVFSAPRHLELGARIFVSCVLGIGMIYTCLILHTLAQYGSKMDKKWNERMKKYAKVSKKNATKNQWKSNLSREIESSPTKNSPKPKVLRKEKKPEVGKTEDRQKIPADAPSEERNGEVGDSDRHERSSESRVQERQQQPPDTPREIRRRGRQPINSWSQLPEGTKHQAEIINGQQPQDLTFAAKAQDEVLEGTKTTSGNASRQRSRESRENGREGVSEAGRQQGVQDRVKEQELYPSHEIEPRTKYLPKEKNAEEGKPNDHQKTPIDSCSEGRKREEGDSDRRRRSSESRAQERQLQPPDMPREIRRRDHQPINPRSQMPEGTAEIINGQQPQDFQPAAKAQGEVLEGTKGTLRNVSRQRSCESRENGRQEILGAGRQPQGVQDRVKEQLEGSGVRKRSQRRSLERRGTRSPRPVVESPRSTLQCPHSVLEGTRSSLRQ